MSFHRTLKYFSFPFPQLNDNLPEKEFENFYSYDGSYSSLRNFTINDIFTVDEPKRLTLVSNTQDKVHKNLAHFIALYKEINSNIINGKFEPVYFFNGFHYGADKEYGSKSKIIDRSYILQPGIKYKLYYFFESNKFTQLEPFIGPKLEIKYLNPAFTYLGLEKFNNNYILGTEDLDYFIIKEPSETGGEDDLFITGNLDYTINGAVSGDLRLENAYPFKTFKLYLDNNVKREKKNITTFLEEGTGTYFSDKSFEFFSDRMQILEVYSPNFVHVSIFEDSKHVYEFESTRSSGSGILHYKYITEKDDKFLPYNLMGEKLEDTIIKRTFVLRPFTYYQIDVESSYYTLSYKPYQFDEYYGYKPLPANYRDVELLTETPE